MVDLAQPFNALIAANQAPAQNPLVTAGQMAQTANALTQVDSNQLDNAQRHLQFITDGLTPLIAKGSNITPSDVAAAGADVVATSKGRIAPDEIASFLTQLPSDGPGIQSFLQQHLMRVQDANSRLATMRGAPVETQTGAGTQFGTRNAFTNTYAPQQGGGYVPNQPGVGLTEGPSIMTPSGPQATRITNQQAMDIANGKAHVDSQGRITYGSGQGAPATAPAPAVPSQGGQPAANAMPNPPVAAASPPIGQAMVVGAPAGAAGAADVASQGSAGQGLSLQKAADQVPQTQATIYNLQSQLDKFTPGPMAERINQGKKIANEAGQLAGVGDMFDPKSIAAQEEFHKQAEMLAQQSFAALGGTGTDQQLASAHGANPNDALSGQGNKQILPMLLGLQDAVQAKNAAWQKYRQINGDASYGQFSNEFNSNFSPRAFQFVRMSPDQRQDLVKSMNPTEQRQLGAALANAEQRGWINPNGQPSGQ